MKKYFCDECETELGEIACSNQFGGSFCSVRCSDIDEHRQLNTLTKSKEDLINKPNHYHQNGIDVIGFSELQFSKEELKGFYRINALKYITRFDRKNGIEDLKKGLFYLNKLLEMEDGANGQKDEKSHSVENI